MTARAAWSWTSPSRRSRRRRGCSPPAATIRLLSTGPVAACAAIAAAARVWACGEPRVRIASISSSDSEPLKSSFGGVGGGLALGLEDAGWGEGVEGGAAGLAALAAAAKPPRAMRSLAALRTPSVSLVCCLVDWVDSSSTMSTTPSARGVGSTHTPESFWFHHRLCATKFVPSEPPSSKTPKPLITCQPHASCTRSALPKLSSGTMETASNLLESSLDGRPVRRHRLPCSPFLPRSPLRVAFSVKHLGQPVGGETSVAAVFFAGSEGTTSDGSGQ